MKSLLLFRRALSSSTNVPVYPGALCPEFPSEFHEFLKELFWKLAPTRQFAVDRHPGFILGNEPSRREFRLAFRLHSPARTRKRYFRGSETHAHGRLPGRWPPCNGSRRNC